MDTTSRVGKVSIQNLQGVNERKSFANPEVTEFDILRNGVPTTAGTVRRMNGVKFLCELTGEPIWSICQTNDSNGTILVQTRNNLYAFTTDELFGREAYEPNLDNIANIEEENMAEALIVHTTGAGLSGGLMANNLNWQQAPLTSIVHQVNPDGTPAAFVTLAANQFTLAAGVYRISGWSKGSVAALTTRIHARLYNVTDAVAAWAGQPNEASDEGKLLVAASNNKMEIGGYLELAGPKTFEIQNRASVATATSTFGTQSTDTVPEVYRWLRILKTA